MTARYAEVIAFSVTMPPGKDVTGRDRRSGPVEAGISAVLYEDHPIRYGNRFLEPGMPALFSACRDAVSGVMRTRPVPDAAGLPLVGQAFALTPDGSAIVSGWWIPGGRGEQRSELVTIDLASGRRRTLAAQRDADFYAPAVSPDGMHVVCLRETHGTPDEPSDFTLWLVPLGGGRARDLTLGLDLWPRAPAWSADSRVVYFSASQGGRGPVFAVHVDTGGVERLTQDDAAYAELCPAPAGQTLHALRSGIDSPPAPVTITAGAQPRQRPLRAPGPRLPVPGTLTEVVAVGADGTRLRGWLARPVGGGPAPLLLWPHGGIHGSWDSWSWRWNPWILTAHGYAVLMPDPALSAGYGQANLRRGGAAWAPVIFDDLMRMTDAAAARPDIDGSRMAVMGGSFGGYMANWIAGHTGRFRAIITHAGIWRWDMAVTTSDMNHYFVREFGEPRLRPDIVAANDPAQYAALIRTPVLVIHGERDFSVPIANSLWLWWDLLRHQVDVKFLYYPDEPHAIRRPGNIVVWYQTALAFLDHHLRGTQWRPPAALSWNARERDGSVRE